MMWKERRLTGTKIRLLNQLGLLLLLPLHRLAVGSPPRRQRFASTESLRGRCARCRCNRPLSKYKQGQTIWNADCADDAGQIIRFPLKKEIKNILPIFIQTGFTGFTGFVSKIVSCRSCKSGQNDSNPRVSAQSAASAFY